MNDDQNKKNWWADADKSDVEGWKPALKLPKQVESIDESECGMQHHSQETNNLKDMLFLGHQTSVEADEEVAAKPILIDLWDLNSITVLILS